MLRQRIITALILAPIALGGVFLLQDLGFALFIAAVLTLGAWEWARLAGLDGPWRLLYAGSMALAFAAAYFLPPYPVLAFGLAWWVLALVMVTAFPSGEQFWGPGPIRMLMGLPLMVPGFVSMLELKQLHDANAMIALLFFLIWGADVGAYFTGKAFGKRKLAPSVSPGKSWAGVYGGMVTALLIAGLLPLLTGAPRLSLPGDVWFLGACLLVVMISVLGDLTISMFKRHAGVKDASNLLPGHGGILDRIDSLLSAGPFFSVVVLLYWGTS